MVPVIKYEDVSPVLYPGWKKTSLYVPGFDGVKLALDYIRPADENGVLEEKPLPVVFMASRGGRFSMDRPNYPGNYFNGDGPLALYLIARGYVYVTAEMRGCGASFGYNTSFSSPENRKDVAAIIKWICSQPWCDGNVGMMGGSNRSFIQMCSPSAETPEGLKAITPCVSNTNFYFTNYPNGASKLPNKLLSGFMEPKKKTKEQFLKTVVPVDDDPNGDEAYRAYEEDQFPHNVNFLNNLIKANMCRDEYNEKFDSYPNTELSAMQYTDKFVKSGIKHHQTAGWFDHSVGSQIAGCNAWGGSILIGPWGHQNTERGSYDPQKYPFETWNIGEEHKRWFDYSLKNMNNGWKEQPKFHYYTINAEDGYHWKWSNQFPLAETVYTSMYLTGTKSGTCSSSNDGSLEPSFGKGSDEYYVRPDIKYCKEVNGETYNVYLRQWDDDMQNNVDAKALTYTGPVLGKDDLRELTGFPTIDLWVSSTQNDGDFIAILEEVFPDGRSFFITDGVIRASHRSTEPNVLYDTVGVPYHPSRCKDVQEKLAEGLSNPTLLQFHMEPTSYVFHEGSRMRVTIWGAEFVTYQHYMYDKEHMPTIKLYHDEEHQSKIVFPMIPKKKPLYTEPEDAAVYHG